mgnify:CR=1 FL=1
MSFCFSHIFSQSITLWTNERKKKRQRLIVIFVIHQHIIFMFANQCSFWLLLILNVFQISQQNEQKNISVCNRESQCSMKLIFVYVRCLYHSPSTQPRKKNSCLFSSYSLHFILIIIIIHYHHHFCLCLFCKTDQNFVMIKKKKLIHVMIQMAMDVIAVFNHPYIVNVN